LAGAEEKGVGAGVHGVAAELKWEPVGLKGEDAAGGRR